jgi:peptidoglycan/xylan/chitin deacetylase (PgdA/CDA1 family)
MRIVAKRVARARAWSVRRRRRQQEPHGIVLMYHRVAAVAADPWHLCVTPANFESQVRALRDTFDLVPLSQLRGQLRQGRGSRPVAAITFDDGYLDNLTVAKPILQRYGAPATVFVATGFLGRPQGFWWDRLSNAILTGAALPPTLELESNGVRFSGGDAALASARIGGRRARRRLHDRLWAWLCDLPDAAREHALARLERWAGQLASQRSNGRPLTEDELRELAADGLVEIGAHTVTHPMLSRLASQDKTTQIERSRSECRRILGHDPLCFSYPNGDHDPESVEIVRRAGFAAACDSHPDLVWSTGDAYRMPRIVVGNESGTALLRRLRWEWLA